MMISRVTRQYRLQRDAICAPLQLAHNVQAGDWHTPRIILRYEGRRLGRAGGHGIIDALDFDSPSMHTTTTTLASAITGNGRLSRRARHDIMRAADISARRYRALITGDER